MKDSMLATMLEGAMDLHLSEANAALDRERPSYEPHRSHSCIPEVCAGLIAANIRAVLEAIDGCPDPACIHPQDEHVAYCSGQDREGLDCSCPGWYHAILEPSP